MAQPQQPAGQSASNLLSEGGWYLYDGKSVTGPFSDNEMLQKYGQEETDQLFASKKGFTKWYTLSEVRNVFQSHTPSEHKEEIAAFRQMLSDNMQQLEKLGAQVPDTSETNATKTLKKVEPTRIATTIEQNMVEETLAGARTATEEQPAPSASASRAIREFKDRQKIREPQHAKKTTDPRELYMILRGRLRLGDIRSTFNVAVMQYLCTLSLSSFFWARKLRQEVFFHVYGEFKPRAFIDYLMVVPFFHFIAIHRLAKLLHNAEQQNHYKRTSVWTATLLGIFPPFAISYLQENTNRHWMLHVVNVRKKQLAKKKSAAKP